MRVQCSMTDPIHATRAWESIGTLQSAGHEAEGTQRALRGCADGRYSAGTPRVLLTVSPPLAAGSVSVVEPARSMRYDSMRSSTFELSQPACMCRATAKRQGEAQGSHCKILREQYSAEQSVAILPIM